MIVNGMRGLENDYRCWEGLKDEYGMLGDGEKVLGES